MSSATPATYATVAVSGSQYRVKSGDRIVVNRLAAEVGSQVVLDSVLLVEQGDGKILAASGGEKLPNAAVNATVEAHLRGDKIRVFKMRRRKKSRRTQGHRQDLTRLTIGEIQSAA